MKTPKRLLILVGVALLGVLCIKFFDFSPKKEAKPKVAIEIPKEIPEPKISKEVKPKPAAATVLQGAEPQKLSPTKSHKRLPPPPGYVDFVVWPDNWAVAFGDQLLGKVDGEVNEGWARTKASPPKLWESSIVPYAFAKDFKHELKVQRAIDHINQKTRVELVPATPEDQNLIVFSNFDTHCASYLGKIGGPQPILVSKECGQQEILHEILHALGFVHEQSRPDRDKYLKVRWENIQPGFELQFDIVPDKFVEHYRGFAFNFDYQSVMMYRPSNFARESGLPTLESVTSETINPAKEGLSDFDILRIDQVY